MPSSARVGKERFFNTILGGYSTGVCDVYNQITHNPQWVPKIRGGCEVMTRRPDFSLSRCQLVGLQPRTIRADSTEWTMAVGLRN